MARMRKLIAQKRRHDHRRCMMLKMCRKMLKKTSLHECHAAVAWWKAHRATCLKDEECQAKFITRHHAMKCMKKKACAAKFVAKWKSFWTMRRTAAKTKHAACMANRKCKAKYMAKRQAMKVALQKKRHVAMERYAKCMKE